MEAPAICREALADRAEESDQLLQMLNTLMDIAEAETGMLKLHLEPVSIPILLAHAVVSRQNAIVIRVTDTGIGMTPDELPKIWDRLYRGDRSRSQRGLGLGLSLVKAVVAAHKGQVEASSEPGVGSTFTITLPLVGTDEHPVLSGNPPSLPSCNVAERSQQNSATKMVSVGQPTYSRAAARCRERGSHRVGLATQTVHSRGIGDEQEAMHQRGTRLANAGRRAGWQRRRDW
ncbi:ATP-binding protein [Cupriavidus sp. CV2]|uniref:sensor histidine kinase n=1 Tax=Cupriavidus ulmosensis TaxID=3065913 RepID=UPI00296ACC50|nr:ATP-binding protein [Cupriavidus sp. CV2]MDW3688989.1 ATP-binding protein [Cupriavidus sp. CV2]